MKKNLFAFYLIIVFSTKLFAQTPCTLTSNSATICEGEGTTLIATNGNSYKWSTGDTLSTINVSPTVTTSYIVTDTISGCADTSTVMVNSLPIITSSDVSICSGDVVTLLASGASTYSWSHGGSSTAENTVSPKLKTKYTVTGTDTNGCSDFATSTVEVFEKPQADFEISPYAPNIYSESITFTDKSTGSITNRTWDFGVDDTTDQHVLSPVKIYEKLQKNYPITLTVSNGQCSDTSYQELVIGPLKPSYIVSYSSNTETYTINVDPNINSKAISFHWDFGDGNNSPLKAPTHTFNKDTVYKVCMKIYTSDGDSAMYCKNIGAEELTNPGNKNGFDIEVTHLVSLSETQLQNETISVSPNPSSGLFTVQLNDNSTANARLFSIGGEIIKYNSYQKDNVIIIDLSAQPDGTYLLEVLQNEQLHTLKLIKN